MYNIVYTIHVPVCALSLNQNENQKPNEKRKRHTERKRDKVKNGKICDESGSNQIVEPNVFMHHHM